jgi:hypothetical protein
MAIRYKVSLTKAEREQITEQTRRGKSTTAKFGHARVLLLPDAGEYAAPWRGPMSQRLPSAPGHGQLVDHKYVRHRVATLFVEVELLSDCHHVEVTERRTRQDWARFIKTILDERSPDATKVKRVMDNLNTDTIASHHKSCPPAEAQRLEIHSRQSMEAGSTLLKSD